jgi:hypothetical protein
VKGKEYKVCKLVKSLYGLEQAPQAWYENMIEHIFKLNFKHFNLDNASLFVNKVGKIVAYLIVYAYYLFITRNNEIYIASINKELKKDFEMKNLGHLHTTIWALKSFKIQSTYSSLKRSMLENF